MRIDEINEKNQDNKPIVFVDMDGVLADFFGEWAKLDGKDHYKDIDNPEAKLQLIREHPTFWLDLPMLPNARKLLAAVEEYAGSYNICSKPLEEDKNSEPQKRLWLKEHLTDFPPREVILTANKAAYATQPDGTPNILIDDFGKNIKAWRKAGGIGIHYEDRNIDRAIQKMRESLNVK